MTIDKHILADVGRPRAFRERYLISQDVGKSRIPILALERCGREQHLVDQDPQRPPIDGAGVSATLDDFRRNVFLRADEAVRSEIRYARLCIDRRHVVRIRVGRDAATRGRPVVGEDHGRRTTAIGLLGQIEV